MNARAKDFAPADFGHDIDTRVAAVDWSQVGADLDAQGAALIERLIMPAECRALAALYPNETLFRSCVVMARHGFGRGEYKYFCYPLPELIASLREAIYRHLVPIANRWHKTMGIAVRFPDAHAEFIARCHASGQQRPTPLLLQYGTGDSTACIRTCTASMCSRCKWRYSCRIRGGISQAASS